VLPAAARFYPQEALGKYVAWKKTPVSPPAVRWSDELLDTMRQQMDPEADFVVRAVYDRGSVAEVNSMLGQMFRSDAPIPAGLPVEVRTYLEREASLPAWADMHQIALAEALFTRAGWQIAAALFCSSLPQAYAAAHGAHVIAQTQGMTRNVRQRVFETAQFLFDTMDEGALRKGGRGVVTVQKVRLMHAGIRHLLLARQAPAWDSARLGFPVNQEDLAGTLLTFSLVTLDALDRLGVDVSNAEAEAWLHAWKVVGALLGVREELLPRDIADARALMDAIRARQWAPSDDGRHLIVPLIQMMQDYFPGRALDGLPVALVRYLAGDHCADLLGLPRTDATLLLVEAAHGLDKILDKFNGDSPLEALVAYATHKLMEGVVTIERDGKQARFRIPPSLRDSLDNHK
jgi:F0F1-type ATP synthase membrane subunit c/vacuolar-type H+-ATPase subunit K